MYYNLLQYIQVSILKEDCIIGGFKDIRVYNIGHTVKANKTPNTIKSIYLEFFSIFLLIFRKISKKKTS